MPVFPSIEWFDTVRTAANETPEFRALGSNETNFGVKVGDQIIRLDFYAFECVSVAEIDEDGSLKLEILAVFPPLLGSVGCIGTG